mgnify:CR=1 FL=1
MSLNLTFYFGNENTFKLELNSRTKFGTLYPIISSVCARRIEEIRYLVCDGQVIGGLNSPYGFNSYIQSVDKLELNQNQLTIHVVFAPSQSQDLVDNYVSRQYKLWAQDQNSEPLTIASMPELQSLLNGVVSTRALSQLFDAELPEGYEQLTQLQDVAVVISQQRFDQIVQPVEHTSEVCTICGQHQTESPGQFVQLPCEHVYHRECIQPYLCQIRSRCPICNRDLRS